MLITIDLEEFTVALRSACDDMHYFLNVEKGSVVPLLDGQFYDGDIELEDMDCDDIDALGIYVAIRHVPSHEAY